MQTRLSLLLLQNKLVTNPVIITWLLMEETFCNPGVTELGDERMADGSGCDGG